MNSPIGNEHDPLSHEHLTAAIATGEATPLSPWTTDFVHYRNHWWIPDAEGWVAVTHEPLSRRLDLQQQREAALSM